MIGDRVRDSFFCVCVLLYNELLSFNYLLTDSIEPVVHVRYFLKYFIVDSVLFDLFSCVIRHDNSSKTRYCGHAVAKNTLHFVYYML